jgi:hypothetical protein
MLDRTRQASCWIRPSYRNNIPIKCTRAGEGVGIGPFQRRNLAAAPWPEPEQAVVGPGRGPNAKARNAIYATCPKPVRQPVTS